MKIYDGKTSKEDELQALTRLASAFQSGSYLYDLFTPDFLNWLAGQIKNDFSPDIMGAYHSTLKQNFEALNSAQAANSQLDAIQKDSKTRLEAKEEEIAHQNGRLVEKNAVIESLHDSIEFWTNKANEAVTERNEAREAIEARDAEIIRLKAKLFDLTEGNR